VFKNLFKKIDQVLGHEHEPSTSPEEKFFSDIVGYPDIKKLFMRSIVSREPVHVLLTGPPACSKTVFLLEMLEGLDNAYFIDAATYNYMGLFETKVI
jgi:Holliday junction DNA helicase RuvB